MVLLAICFSEVVVIGHVYGAERMYDNIRDMTGRVLHPWFGWCWKYITPAFTFVRRFELKLTENPVINNLEDPVFFYRAC